jgi:hypothetical protein
LEGNGAFKGGERRQTADEAIHEESITDSEINTENNEMAAVDESEADSYDAS